MSFPREEVWWHTESKWYLGRRKQFDDDNYCTNVNNQMSMMSFFLPNTTNVNYKTYVATVLKNMLTIHIIIYSLLLAFVFDYVIIIPQAKLSFK